MRNYFRRCQAAGLALALAITMFPAPLAEASGVQEPAAEAQALEDAAMPQAEIAPLAEFDFNTPAEGNFYQGGDAKAEIHGNCGLTVREGEDRALALDGGRNYLTVTKQDGSSLLTGLEEMTVSYDAKVEGGGANWAFFASPNTNQQTYQQEKYLGFLHSNGKLTVERYNNSGARPANPDASVAQKEWVHVDVVAERGKTAIYVNGLPKSRMQSAVDLKELFGGNGILQIGKANWGADGEFYNGQIDNLTIYGQALSPERLVDAAQAALLVEAEKDALTLPQIASFDFMLPMEGGNFTSIAWSVKEGADFLSIQDSLAKVTRPGMGEQDVSVVLAATVKLGTAESTKEFQIKIPAATSEDLAAGIVIPRYITSDLQTEASGEKITWSCDKEGLVSADGKVTLPEEAQGSQKAVVTASVGGTALASGEAEFLPYGGSVLTYVTKGEDLLAYEDSRRTDALYVAVKDGQGYEPLNKGKALLYVKWSGDQKDNPDRQMGSPSFFRKADGTLGVVASANNHTDSIYLWDTEGTVAFINERLLKLNGNGIAVQDPAVVFDSASGQYKVFWKGGNGSSYLTVLENLTDTPGEGSTIGCTYQRTEADGALPANADASQSSVFVMSKAEYTAFTRKYGTLHNTKIQHPQVQVQEGGTLSMPETVTAEYSDGSTKDLGVVWDAEDLKKIDTTKPGTYTVKGDVQQDAYAYPFIAERADPHIFYNEDDGYYYSTGSYYEPNMTSNNVAQSYRKLDLRRAKTIEGLKEAEEHYLLESKVGDRWGGFFWAPEFHKINGTWYCLVGAHDFGTGGIQSNTNWNTSNWCSRSILIPYIGDGDNNTSIEEDIQAGGMLDASQWGEPITLDLPSDAGASFDVSYYKADDGQGYYIVPRNAQLLIIKARGGDGVTPQPEGSATTLKGLQWPWEFGIYEGSVTPSNPKGNDQGIVEGPYLFSYGDKVYISYSGATVDKYYCLGLMMADKDSDLMDPGSWTQLPYPALSSYDTYEGAIGGGAHVGGGHNSIVQDEYGNLALVYHARPYPDPHQGMNGAGGLFDPCRHTVVKGIHVAYDGTLVFNMTAEEEVDPKEAQGLVANVQVGGEIKDVPVTKVTLDRTSLSLEIGKERQLKATIAPANATDKSLVWESDHPEIASVAQDGTVSAKAAGTAVISVLAAGGKRASCQVTVKEAPLDIEGLLARYPLSKDAKDISGNGKDGQVHGNVSWGDGLELPGGKKTNDANASYVTLPGDLFTAKEDLTISVWIKSATGSGNYAALFFGTEPQGNSMPLNYWLFNPTNPDGLFKSVFTNSNNSGAPYNSEVGVASGTTSEYRGVWTHYTTVLTERSIVGYINGKKVGTASKSKKVAEFGNMLQAYIGRSNYVNDDTYAGSFQDLQIYAGAMSEEEVEGLYFDTSQVSQSIQESMLPSIAESLSLEEQLPNGVLMEAKTLELPAQWKGASVQWASDNEQVIAKDGKVTLPAQQETVTLTASLSFGNVKAQKTFQITVLPAGGSLSYVAENLQIPYVLDKHTALPMKVADVSIVWSGNAAVKNDGTIAPGFDGKQEAALEATLSSGGRTQKKSFQCQIMGKDAVYVESYTRNPSGDMVNKLARSMFLAFRENEEDSFAALHDDYGVLFMRAESNANTTLTPKGLKDPYLFHTKDGKYGVVAVRTEENGAKDKTKASSVMLYISEDLVNYDEIGFVDLHGTAAVCEPVCEYDSAAGIYRITWNDGEGNYYQNTLSDLTAGSKASAPKNAMAVSIRKAELGLSGANAGNLLPLEHEKGIKLRNKLSKLVNTGMETPASIKANKAEDVKNVRATALYNDGSTASKQVDWDLSGISFDTPGTYTVNGTVTQPTFDNSKALFNARPDPEMAKYNGKFYFISTDEHGQGRIYIRESDTLEGIKDSTEALLLDGNSYPDLFKACLWAPELHVIEGELYVFFAGSMTDWSGVQSHVMKLKEGGDPTKASDWEKPIRVKDQDGNNLYNADTQGITLDMTYFEANGQSYVVWAQRQRHPVDNGSWLYIATVDKAQPWKLTSDRVCICKPDYGWDNNNTFVVEGPFALQKDGKIYLTFSGGATDHTYCVGVMTALEDSDLLDANAWRKSNSPILTSWSVEGQYGPGHNAYVYDDDGTVYNTYHAKWGRSATRSASIRRVHFDIDGDPVLDLVEERDLVEQYKQVSMQVEVVGADYDFKEELKSLCQTYGSITKKPFLTAERDWAVFTERMAKAKELLNQPDASAAELQEAAAKLKEAAGKLVYFVKVEIANAPNKVSYRIGEALDLSGLKVIATDNNGGRHELEKSQYTVSGFDSKTSGRKTVTVTSEGKSGSFVVSVEQPVPPAPKPPKTPSITKTSSSYNAITLKWKKVSGADGYTIYRATSKNGKYKKIKTIAKASTVTYKNSKLSFRKTYYYKIKAYKKSGKTTVESSFSKAVSAKTKLAAPSVSLKKKSKTKLTIQWKKVSGASGYQIQYSLKKKSGYKKVTVKGSGKKSYTKPGLKKGKTYYVKVRAYRTVKGKKIYGAYSSIKQIKMK